jgi:hypothetical protein
MWKMLGAHVRHTETRLVVVLLSVIVLADVALRLTDQSLSGNLAHIEDIPALIGKAGVAPRESMLILGNSLTNNGVAADAIERQFADMSVAKVTPDATALWDWQCLLDHQVVDRPDVQFDTIVIGYAWHLLSDQTRSDPSRLGSLYCRADDLLAPSAIGLGSIGEVTEFLVARSLRLYALRDTLRNRLLAFLIPHYKQFTQSANENRAGASAAPVVDVTYTYSHFESLADRLAQKDTSVIVVAMPVQQEYDLDPQLQALARRGKIRLLDLRHVEGIDASSYLDAMHLNNDGRQTLTRRLMHELRSGLVSTT